jgi:hypothetical protein
LTGLLFFLGEIILEIRRAGAVAAIANPNINNTGLKLPATSPTKVAKKPVGEYKNLCTFNDHFLIKLSFSSYPDFVYIIYKLEYHKKIQISDASDRNHKSDGFHPFLVNSFPYIANTCQHL